MDELLPILLALNGNRPVCSAPGDWLPTWRATQAAHADTSPFTAAVAATVNADRLAWAFFSAYQGALQAGFGAARGHPSAFCANESQRKLTEIATTLDEAGHDLRLSGSKSWTLAGFDDLVLFVLARRRNGPAKGPGSLAVVRVALHSPGVALQPARPQAIVPELPHAEVRFASTPVSPDDVVPGDGYADHAKPFRLREDVFVTGCALAYLLAEARQGSWPTTWCQRAIAAVTMLEGCSRRDPRTDDTIIAVAGVLSLAGDVLREADTPWQPAQQQARDRWHRDRPLLLGGKDARRQRAIRAWEAMGRMPREEWPPAP